MTTGMKDQMDDRCKWYDNILLHVNWMFVDGVVIKGSIIGNEITREFTSLCKGRGRKVVDITSRMNFRHPQPLL
ncbi:hypothetical protein QQG55_53380 [Brugia pahangi]